MLTHEEFIHEVAKLGLQQRAAVRADDDSGKYKLVYGVGRQGLRGVTYFNKWLTSDKDQAHFVEICASAEQSPVQLAGTVLHELGHVMAGFQAGHGKEWHDCCESLGLRAIKAAGTDYKMAMFSPAIRPAIAQLIDRLNDGKPLQIAPAPVLPRPCSAAIGTRGGTSRGAGSGSRLRKWLCKCDKPVIVRVASDDFQATCGRCNQPFVKES